MTFILHNFNLIESTDFQLDIKNRGFLFGDGFFETMICENGEIRFVMDHINRFTNGIKAYQGKLGDEISIDQMVEKLNDLTNHHPSSGLIKIKLTAYRVSTGGYSPTSNRFETIAFCEDYTPSASVKKAAIIYNDMKVQYSPISAFKNLSADVYIQAGLFMRTNNCDEVILLGAHSKIAECLYSNVYWLKNNTIYTPSLETGCVSGISRARIIEKIKNSNYKIEEGLYNVDDLLNADFVFNSNVGGICSIEKIGETQFQPAPKGLLELLN